MYTFALGLPVAVAKVYIYLVPPFTWTVEKDEN